MRSIDWTGRGGKCRCGHRREPHVASRLSMVVLLATFLILGIGLMNAQSTTTIYCTNFTDDALATDPVTLQRAHRFSEAALVWRQEIDAANQPPVPALQEWAYCLYESAGEATALAACDELERADKKGGRHHFIRGLIYVKSGKVTQARESFHLARMAGEKYAALQLQRLETTQ